MSDTDSPRMRSIRKAAADIAHKQGFVDRWCWLATSQDGMTVTELAGVTAMPESEARLGVC